MQKIYLFIILIFSNFIMTEIHAAPNFAVRNLTSQDVEGMVKANVLKTPYIFDPFRLRILTISYYDFNGKIHNDGEMVVLDAVAAQTISIFKNLSYK